MIRLSRRRALGMAGASALSATTLRGRRALAQGAGKVRVGCIIPLTGVQAQLGHDCQAGIEIGRDRINAAGGVLGRPIELVIRDDKVNPNQAVAAARELASSGVNLIIGGLNTATTLGITGIATDLDIVFMSCGAVTDSMTHEMFNKHYFRSNNNNIMRGRAASRLMAQKFPDVTNWGAMLFDNEYSNAAWRAFSAGLREFYPAIAKKDVNVLPPIYGKPGSGDFKVQISQLMATPIQGLLNSIVGEDLVTMLNQARPFGMTDRLSVIMDGGADFTIAKVLKGNMPRNFWSISHWYYAAYQDIPEGQALYKEYVKRTGDEAPSAYVEVAHACLDAFTYGVGKAGSTSTAAVIAALEGATIRTAKGPMLFRAEDHQAIGDVNLLNIAPSPNPPGWVVPEFVNVPGKDVVEPAAPGQKA